MADEESPPETEAPSPSRKRARRLVALALVAITLGVFQGVRHHGFVDWDDGPNIYENPYLGGSASASLYRFWKAPYLELYVPLTYTVWSAVGMVARDATHHEGAARYHALPFHAVNVLLHCVSALLVLAILRIVVRLESAALAGALLFAIHPVQAEPVAWVTGLKDVLGGVLALAALWQYLRSVPPTDAPGSRAVRPAAFALASALFMLALLSKPSAVVVPLMAAILDRCAFGRPARTILLCVGGWVALALAWTALIVRVQEPGERFVTPLLARPLIATDALMFYLRKIALPLNLVVDYGRHPRAVLGAGVAAKALTAAAAAALAIGVWLSRKRLPWLAAGALLFIAALSPVLGLVPFGFQQTSTVADRYLYLAMLGPAVIAAGALARWRRPLPTLAFGLLAVFWSLRCAEQLGAWRDTRTLFERTLAVNPRSWVAHNLTGLSLARDGRLDQALPHYLAAIEINPEYVEAHYHLGLARLERGELAEAEAAFREAIRRRPGFADAHNNLGIVLARQGHRDEAIAAYREAVRVRPGYAEGHVNLGNALAKQGSLSEATKEYELALASQPDHPEALSNLGVIMANERRLDEAVALFERALAVRPDYVAVRRNLAAALRGLGRIEEARSQEERARALANPEQIR